MHFSGNWQHCISQKTRFNNAKCLAKQTEKSGIFFVEMGEKSRKFSAEMSGLSKTHTYTQLAASS